MKICILGAGRMGSWLARSLAATHEVYVLEKRAPRRNALYPAHVLANLQAIGQVSPDVLLNCVPLGVTIEAFEEALPFIPSECILADIASVKGGLPDFYRAKAMRFVSVHPMFGPTFAHPGDLGEENAIIIRESDEEGKAIFREFFRHLGVALHEYSFDDHDRMMAYSLTLPFVSSFMFASCVNGSEVPGTTFRRHMRVAKGLLSEDEHLLMEILFNSHSPSKIQMLLDQLEELRSMVTSRDGGRLSTYLARLRKNLSLTG